MEFRKMVTITLCTRQQKRHWGIEQSFGLCGRGRGWEDLGEWHWSMYNIIYEMSCQSRFDARYWMLGTGALGRPRGMVWGGRREEGSGCGTHVCLWRIHFNIWQNQYNIVKFKNKIKFKNNNKKRNVESELPWFVPSLMGKAVSVSPLNVSYSGLLFIYLFEDAPYYFEKVPFCSCFFGFLSWLWSFVKKILFYQLIWLSDSWFSFFSLMCCANLFQLCLTFCDPMNCSLPSSSVHGIL